MYINSMNDLVDLPALQGMLEVSRSRAYVISRDRTFPEPELSAPRWRAWRRGDVEAWLDRYRPEWRRNSPRNERMISAGVPVHGRRADGTPSSQAAAALRRHWYRGRTTWTIDSAHRLMSIARRTRKNR